MVFSADTLQSGWRHLKIIGEVGEEQARTLLGMIEALENGRFAVDLSFIQRVHELFYLALDRIWMKGGTVLVNVPSPLLDEMARRDMLRRFQIFSSLEEFVEGLK